MNLISINGTAYLTLGYMRKNWKRVKNVCRIVFYATSYSFLAAVLLSTIWRAWLVFSG